jgi:hypothetical protein
MQTANMLYSTLFHWGVTPHRTDTLHTLYFLTSPFVLPLSPSLCTSSIRLHHQIWDIMRATCKRHPPTKSSDNTAADAASLILARQSKTVVDFTVPESLKGPKKQALRFAPNPGNPYSCVPTLESDPRSFYRINTSLILYNALRCTALHCTALHYTTLLYPTLLQRSAGARRERQGG